MLLLAPRDMFIETSLASHNEDQAYVRLRISMNPDAQNSSEYNKGPDQATVGMFQPLAPTW